MFWNTGITKDNELRTALFVLVVLSAMLLPSISLHPALPNIRLEEIFLFGIFGLNILYVIFCGFKTGIKGTQEALAQRKPWRSVSIVFMLLLTSYTVSNLYGVFFKDGTYTLRDVMELITYLKYFLIITLGISLNINNEELAYLSKAVVFGVLILTVMGWRQHLNIFNMNTWLSPYFDQAHWDTLIYGNPARALGSFDNPNVFGTFTVIILSFLVTRYYFADHDGKFPFLLFVFLGIVIRLEYLTISRTALFGIAVVFSLASIWAFFHTKYDRKTIIKIMALLVLTLALIITTSNSFLYRVQEGMDFSNSTSFQGHMARWQSAAHTISESPVLGWGTEKSTMTTLVDNEYALYTRRYGIVGLACYLWFFLQPFKLAVQRIRHIYREHKSAGLTESFKQSFSFDIKTLWAASYAVLLPAILVYNFMAGIFYNLQLMTVMVAAMGLVYNTAREE
jgi:O-antigen ligase